MGRNAAGASFLTGLFKYAESSEFDCLVSAEDSGNQFSKLLAAHRPVARQTGLRPRPWLHSGGLGVFFTQAPLSEHQHSIVSARVTIILVVHLWDYPHNFCLRVRWTQSPTDNGTCATLGCSGLHFECREKRGNRPPKTSRCVARTIGYYEIVLPQLPVIPLGVHCKDFEYSKQRLQARERLGAGDNTLVVLYMGRLAFHAKAHPLAMYQALEAAASVTKKSHPCRVWVAC